MHLRKLETETDTVLDLLIREVGFPRSERGKAFRYLVFQRDDSPLEFEFHSTTIKFATLETYGVDFKIKRHHGNWFMTCYYPDLPQVAPAYNAVNEQLKALSQRRG